MKREAKNKGVMKKASKGVGKKGENKKKKREGNGKGGNGTSNSSSNKGKGKGKGQNNKDKKANKSGEGTQSCWYGMFCPDGLTDGQLIEYLTNKFDDNPAAIRRMMATELLANTTPCAKGELLFSLQPITLKNGD